MVQKRRNLRCNQKKKKVPRAVLQTQHTGMPPFWSGLLVRQRRYNNCQLAAGYSALAAKARCLARRQKTDKKQGLHAFLKSCADRGVDRRHKPGGGVFLDLGGSCSVLDSSSDWTAGAWTVWTVDRLTGVCRFGALCSRGISVINHADKPKESKGRAVELGLRQRHLLS